MHGLNSGIPLDIHLGYIHGIKTVGYIMFYKTPRYLEALLRHLNGGEGSK